MLPPPISSGVAPAPNSTAPAAAPIVVVLDEKPGIVALACTLFRPTPPSKAGPDARPAARVLSLPVAEAVTALPFTWNVLLVGADPLLFQPTTKLLTPERAPAARSPRLLPRLPNRTPKLVVPACSRLPWLLDSVTGPELVTDTDPTPAPTPIEPETLAEVPENPGVPEPEILATDRLLVFSVAEALWVLPFTASTLLVTVPPPPVTVPVMASTALPAVVAANPVRTLIDRAVVLVAVEPEPVGRFACTLASARLCAPSPPCSTVKPLAVPKYSFPIALVETVLPLTETLELATSPAPMFRCIGRPGIPPALRMARALLIVGELMLELSMVSSPSGFLARMVVPAFIWVLLTT